MELLLLAKKVVYLNIPYYHYMFDRPQSLSRVVNNSKYSSMAKVMSDIELFAKSNNLLSPAVIDSISYRKIYIKKVLTQLTRGQIQLEYSSMFPEVSNKYIWTNRLLSPAGKLTLYLASNNMIRVVNCLYRVSFYFKKIYYKCKPCK